MKKVLLFLSMMFGWHSVHASGFEFLTFETTDGTKVSVPASQLTIAIEGTTLKVGLQSFPLTNMSKMYFSTTNETTGIKTLTADDWNAVTEIFDLQGRKVAKDQMARGQVYVVKSKGGTYKIVAK